MGMVDQNLLNYIWGYLQQGYDVAAIQSALVSQGYDQKAVDEAFQTVYASNYHNDVQIPGQKYQEKHLHITTTEIIAGLVLVVGLLIFGIVFIASPSDAPVDEFTAFEQPGIPESLEPVAPIPDEPDPVPTQIFESEQRDEPEVIEPVIEPDQEELRELSRLEIEQLVVSLGTDDPATAASYCPQILTRNGENSCYAKIALASQDPKYCNFVSEEKQQDFCYLQFAIEGKGTQAICGNIKNTYRQESCLQLLALHTQQELIPENPPTDPIPVLEDAYVDERFTA